MSAPIQFSDPAYLALLAGLPWLWRRYGEQGSKAARILRSTVGVLLVLGLAGPRVAGGRDGRNVMFVLDQSASIAESDRTAAIERLRRDLTTMTDDDRAGLVVFGKDALVEEPPSRRLALSDIRSRPDRSATDIAGALRLASAMVAGLPHPEIVLLTDGHESVGDARAEAALAASRGIKVDIVAMGGDADPPHRDSFVEQISAPRQIRADEPFEVTVDIAGRRGASVSVRLSRDGEQVAVQQAVLTSQGRGRLRFVQRLDRRGFHRYSAGIDRPEDRPPQGDTGGVAVHVRPRPSVLFLGSSSSTAGLARILDRHGFDVDTSGELAAHDALVLDGSALGLLRAPQVRAVEQHVANGGGLIVRGVLSGLGLAGHTETPIGELIPLQLGRRDRQQASRLAVVLMIDKSGSMAADENGLTKLDAAQEAARSLLDLLEPGDLFGMIAFDRQVSSTLELRDAVDHAEIEQFIDSLEAGGGTAIDRAVQTAYEWLDPAPVERKHALLLSDGQVERDSLERLQTLVSGSDTVLSTVGMGDDADRGLLGELAGLGGGRAYVAGAIDELQSIFVREAALIKGDWFVERASKLRGTDHEVLRGITLSDLPTLDGYLAASLKPSASPILIAEDETPILAAWRNGLGRVATLTAEPRWDCFEQMWVQLVRWSAAKPSSENLQVSLELEGATAGVTVDAYRSDGSYADFMDVRCIIDAPEAGLREFRLRQTATGRYEGRADIVARGSHLLEVVATHGESGERESAHLGFHISTLQEQRVSGVNESLLREMARLNHGSVRADSAFGPVGSRVTYVDVSRIAALAALLLFLFEVRIRRRVEAESV